MFINFELLLKTRPLAPFGEPTVVIVPSFIPVAPLSRYIPIEFSPLRFIVPLFVAIDEGPVAYIPILSFPVTLIIPVELLIIFPESLDLYPAAIPIENFSLVASEAPIVITELFVAVPPSILYIPTFPIPVPKFIFPLFVTVPAP